MIENRFGWVESCSSTAVDPYKSILEALVRLDEELRKQAYVDKGSRKVDLAVGTKERHARTLDRVPKQRFTAEAMICEAARMLKRRTQIRPGRSETGCRCWHVGGVVVVVVDDR